MSSRKRQQEKKHYGLRKRARLGDITNSKQQVQLSAPCPRPVSLALTENCINQCVPENEFPPEETDTSMFCSENFDFLPSKRKQPFPKRCVELTPGGLFSSLPTEVLHNLFSLLDLESMVSLCLSSTVTVSYIRGYMYTPAGLAHVLPPLVTDIMNSVCTKKFRLLGEFSRAVHTIVELFPAGMIVKAVSVLDALKNRLKVAAFFLDKVESFVTKCAACDCVCIALASSSSSVHPSVSNQPGNLSLLWSCSQRFCLWLGGQCQN